jgi:hypothetical protein
MSFAPLLKEINFQLENHHVDICHQWVTTHVVVGGRQQEKNPLEPFCL